MPSARHVSAADKLHNALTILADVRVHGLVLWGRFTAGRDGSLWYYRALVQAFEAHGRTALVDELDRTVSAIEADLSKPARTTIVERTSDPPCDLSTG